MADIWESLAPSLLTLGGAAVATNANTNAANTAGGAAVASGQIQADAIAQATQQAQWYAEEAKRFLLQGNQAAAQEMQSRSDAAMRAVTQGNTEAIKTYSSVAGQTAPGVSYLRQAVADPGSLTPAQQEQLEKQRLANANTIHSSTFAGSGRTAAALLKQNETDFTNAALDTNRNRAMTAAGTLAGANITANNNVGTAQQAQGTQTAGINMTTGTTLSGNDMATGTQIANTDNSVGKNVADMTTAAGKAIGTGTQTAGLYDAQSQVASGTVQGKAIGEIGSQIASQSKLSRYGDATSSGSSSSKKPSSSDDWA